MLFKHTFFAITPISTEGRNLGDAAWQTSFLGYTSRKIFSTFVGKIDEREDSTDYIATCRADAEGLILIISSFRRCYIFV